MRDQQKRILVEKAKQLIEEIVVKNLSQKDIATLTGINKTTLSKLKTIEYLPGNVEELIQRLSDLKTNLDNNPKEAVAALYHTSNTKNPFRDKLILFTSGAVVLLSLGLGILLLSSAKANKPITIKQAFETIFESEMQIDPYAKDIQLPCYEFQSKWQMDSEQAYTIVLPLMDAVYYYRSKSVDLYAWCQNGDTTGNHLDALELFTNELWKDTKRRKENCDSLKSLDFNQDPSFIKLADITTIFSDIIKVEKNPKTGAIQPISRSGTQIARYDASEMDTNFAKEVNMVIDHYISCLSKTDCHSITLSDDQPGREYTLTFNCTFFASTQNCNIPEQEYSKVIWK